ncbi:hypothetical protein NC653_035001 [Populus alba x Populus x berolinensis]|uniref:Uncharacterized protein n=1 Tax=Populus alba x Populus x berolinensis TaxID=444605 RepID=A0AAD6PYG7_9ROSI|nr:hypothetical protein NC653_035001 [Populus alba x Populus x berolinensis]
MPGNLISLRLVVIAKLLSNCGLQILLEGTARSVAQQT